MVLLFGKFVTLIWYIWYSYLTHLVLLFGTHRKCYHITDIKYLGKISSSFFWLIIAFTNSMYLNPWSLSWVWIKSCLNVYYTSNKTICILWWIAYFTIHAVEWIVQYTYVRNREYCLEWYGMRHCIVIPLKAKCKFW